MKKFLLITALFTFSVTAVAGLARTSEPAFVGKAYSSYNTTITTWMVTNDSPEGFDQKAFQPLKEALEASGYTERDSKSAENICYIRDLESPTVAATLTCVRRDTPLAHTIGLANDKQDLIAIFQDIGKWANPSWVKVFKNIEGDHQ